MNNIEENINFDKLDYNFKNLIKEQKLNIDSIENIML